MVVKEYFEKLYTSKQRYQERNSSFSILFLIQHNCILSRLVVYKKPLTSVAKDLILVQHQPLNEITKIQTIGCKYFLLYSFNYLINIFLFF